MHVYDYLSIYIYILYIIVYYYLFSQNRPRESLVRGNCHGRLAPMTIFSSSLWVSQNGVYPQVWASIKGENHDSQWMGAQFSHKAIYTCAYVYIYVYIMYIFCIYCVYIYIYIYIVYKCVYVCVYLCIYIHWKLPDGDCFHASGHRRDSWIELFGSSLRVKSQKVHGSWRIIQWLCQVIGDLMELNSG